MSATYDNVSSKLIEGGGDVDTATWNHTINSAGSGGGVLVACDNVNGVLISSVTVNGQAATLIDGPDSGSYGNEMYVFWAPTGAVTGSIPIVVTWQSSTGNDTWIGMAQSWSSVNQDQTFTTANVQHALGSGGGNNTVTATVTVPSGGGVATFVGGHFDASGAPTTSTGTSVLGASDGSLLYGASYGTAGTQTWTIDSDNSTALVVVALSPGGAGPTNTGAPGIQNPIVQSSGFFA